MQRLAFALPALLVLSGFASPTARAEIITFDDGAVAAGSVLSLQYASLGVTFSIGGGNIPGVVNPVSTTQGFATNTSMLIGTPTGVAAPLSGLALRTNAGWLTEDGDPVFTMTFTQAVTALSIDFGAVGPSTGQPSIFAVNPLTGVAVAVGATALANGTVTAVGIPTGATTFVVLPGSFNDYVALDNINFTVVPEPSTWALALGGTGLLGVVVRRRRGACGHSPNR